MILKEFWLDLSLDHFIVDKCERVKSDHPALKETFDFFMQTKCVTNYFGRLNKKKISCGFYRLIIKCCKTPPDNNFVEMLGVCTVNVAFDYEAYLNLSINEKKACALCTLLEGLEIASSHFGWDMDVFYSISNQIVQNNYVNEWAWKKRLRNKDGGYYVEVIASVEWDAFRLFVKLNNSQKELLCKKVVYKELPDDRLYLDIFGKVEWSSDTELTIYDKNKKIISVVDLSDFIY